MPVDVRKLNQIVRFARQNSAFYSNLYDDVPDEIDDIAQLPVIDLVDFWAANSNASNQLLTAPLTDAVVYKSGGTTGSPKFSYYTRGEWESVLTDTALDMVANGLRSGHRVANLFYSGQLYAGFLFLNESLLRSYVDNVRLPMGGTATPEANYHLLADFGAEVIGTMPTTISRTASYMLAHGYVLPSVEFIFFMGEPVFDDQRRLIAAAFPNAEICALIYGSVDAGLVGHPIRSSDQRVFRAPRRDSVIEVVDDETGEPIREVGRSGRLLKTDLNRRLMPILRYPVGDRAQWIDYAAGSFRLLGRHNEAARIGPVSIYVADVRQVLGGLPGAEAILGIQLVATRIAGRDRLTIRLASRPDFMQTEIFAATLIDEVCAARPTIMEEVRAGSIHPLDVDWLAYNDLTINERTGKLQSIVDLRS